MWVELKVQFSTEKLHVDNNVKRMVGMIKELVKVTGSAVSLFGDMFSFANIHVLIDFLCSY